MGQVDYVPFATGGGANVYPPATYQALAVVGSGVQPGLADPQLANTTWRLASMIQAAVATYISNQLGINVLDDGNLANLVANLASAISLGSKTTPGRLVTTSTPLAILVTDYIIGLNRTVGVAAQAATLPTPAVNQEFVIQDIVGNLLLNPVTVSPPGGHSIAGRANFIMAEDRQTATFHYYGSGLWGVSTS